MTDHEMRDTVARSLCRKGTDEPCAFCKTEAGLAVVALAEAGYLHHLRTDDGAALRGAKHTIAAALADRRIELTGEDSPLDYDGARLVLRRLTEGGFTVTHKTGGGAGDTPPAASAAPLAPAAQAGEAIGSPAPPSPRRFALYRHEDPSGVSGTGWVAEGVQFADGAVALRWPGEHPCTVHWDSIERIIAVHGHGGLTVVVWLDEETQQP